MVHFKEITLYELIWWGLSWEKNSVSLNNLTAVVEMN